jgi:hypothetical protein
MACKALAGLVGLGWLIAGVAGAQEAQPPDDIPDHMEQFREVPPGGHTPHPQWESVFEERADAAESGPRGSALTGEVVRAEEDRLWLWHGGVVIPLTLDEETRFVAGREETLQPGREVRTRLQVGEDGEPVVLSVEPLEGAPGR